MGTSSIFQSMAGVYEGRRTVPASAGAPGPGGPAPRRSGTMKSMLTSAVRPADPDLVRRALAGAARAGPYFALSVGDDGRRWRPAAALYADGLGALIAGTGARLGVAEARVAASTVQLGYAARLW